MNDTTLLHITNPRSFQLPDLYAFTVKALLSSPLVSDAEGALMELVQYMDHPAVAIFVVREGQEFVGLAVAENNPSPFTNGCTVLHFYNRGSADARKLLIYAIVGFARAGGLRKIRGIDVNQSPKAFARLFRAAGVPKERGQLIEFELPEEASA